MRSVVLLWAVALLIAGCAGTRPPERPSPDISLYPAEGAVIWGHQVLTLDFDPRDPPVVAAVRYTVAGETRDLLTPQHPLNDKPDRFEISFCAECLDAAAVTVAFEFASPDLAPIVRHYRIDHRPVLAVAVEDLGGGSVLLDARETYDPEGKPLVITWSHLGTVSEGPTYRTTRTALREDSVYVRAEDGVTFVDDFVIESPGGILILEEKMACTAMQVVNRNASLLVPRLQLGPTLRVGQRLPVDANGRTTRDFLLKHVFEVRGTLTNSVFVFEEGQDVARSASFNAADPLATRDKRGRLRNESNRTELFGNPIAAPFGALPVWDNYDNHPRVGKIDINVANGISEIDAVTKRKVKSGNAELMVWLDAPGIAIKRGGDISGGLFYRANFRAWMIPTLPACEKSFVVEIEVDGTGTVTKNELRMQ